MYFSVTHNTLSFYQEVSISVISGFHKPSASLKRDRPQSRPIIVPFWNSDLMGLLMGDNLYKSLEKASDSFFICNVGSRQGNKMGQQPATNGTRVVNVLCHLATARGCCSGQGKWGVWNHWLPTIQSTRCLEALRWYPERNRLVSFIWKTYNDI